MPAWLVLKHGAVMHPAYGALRAIGEAESVLGDAIEAEGRVDARARNQISLIDVGADRGRVERRALAAVGAALRDGFFIDRVIEDGVDIDEVHAVRNVEALTVGVVAVGGERARQVLGAGARSRVIAEREGSAAARDEIGRRERDVGVGGAEDGRPVGGIAPERVRVGVEVHDAGLRCRRDDDDEPPPLQPASISIANAERKTAPDERPTQWKLVEEFGMTLHRNHQEVFF